MKKFLSLAMLVLTLGACTTVEDYEVAVGRTRFTGNVHDRIYAQGLRSLVGKSLYKYSFREVQYPEKENSDQVTVLTGDQLQVQLEVAYMWKIEEASCVPSLYLSVGDQRAVEALVHKVYREATRDAVAEVTAANLLSQGRQGLSARMEELMNIALSGRCVLVTDFFVRDVEPPPSLRAAIEQKLTTEQQVQAQAYQTQVVREQANQRREEAAGIRDAQAIIAESLQGNAGERYLYWRGLEAMENVGKGENNMIIVPTENGAPIFFGAPGN